MNGDMYIVQVNDKTKNQYNCLNIILFKYIYIYIYIYSVFKIFYICEILNLVCYYWCFTAKIFILFLEAIVAWVIFQQN